MKTIFNIISIISFVLFVYPFFFQKTNEIVMNSQTIEIEETEHVCYISEEMPRFPGCEKKEFSKRERQNCSQDEMLKFVFSNLKYPPFFSSAEGTVVVQFTVEKDGSLADIKIVKCWSPKLGEEIVRVVKKMPRWIPEKQAGKEVRFRFTLPIKIHLQ